MNTPRYYQVQAQVQTKLHDGWTGSVQIPTFVLDANIQGIVSHKHAMDIAGDVLLTGRPDHTLAHVVVSGDSVWHDTYVVRDGKVQVWTP